MACFVLLAGCDDEGKGLSKVKDTRPILATKIYVPSKVTVDVELLQTKGIVQMETVLLHDEVTQIGQMLYFEHETWVVKDAQPYGHKHPHQLNQFLYRYAGFDIDTRKTITLIKVWEKPVP